MRFPSRLFDLNKLGEKCGSSPGDKAVGARNYLGFALMLVMVGRGNLYTEGNFFQRGLGIIV